MKSIAQTPFLKLAMVPLTAALAGFLLVMAVYFLQPCTAKQSPQSVYQDEIGIVQTMTPGLATENLIQVL